MASLRSAALCPRDLRSPLSADLLQTGDILGQDDLNNRLAQHAEIEGRHYKLWLASRAVLDRVLNNAIVTQSEFKVQKVYAEIRRYVQSDALARALATLNSDRIVILAGPPGVGKTTLANMLLYAHLEKGYRAIVIQRDVQDGQRLFQEGERQIFYFDDFMGSTFLGDRVSAYHRNEDQAIPGFLRALTAWAEGSNPADGQALMRVTAEVIAADALADAAGGRHGR
jgi:DNA polymerase III delta prime subunit